MEISLCLIALHTSCYQEPLWNANACQRFFFPHPDWKAEFILFPSGVSNNPPADGQQAFDKMKNAIQPELSKSGISPERISIVNGFNKPEEENSMQAGELNSIDSQKCVQTYI